MQQIGGEERVYEDTRAMKRGWVEQHAVRGLVNTNKKGEMKGKKRKEKMRKRKEEEPVLMCPGQLCHSCGTLVRETVHGTIDLSSNRVKR